MVAKVLVAGACVCASAAGLLAGAAPAAAQVWNSASARALMQRATDLRARQLADTGLVDYHATAHGYVMFLAQLGLGLSEPPKIVKADQLALEVYWHAPNFSKQIIQGRRDTLLLPTDIVYHRDHLGIVQNNFPSAIRLGEGDEVRDVPHPLSVPGLALYDAAIADSVRVTLPPPAAPITVYRVLVRPRDDRRPGIVGAIYIEPHGGQVVRMAFSFTRASFLDADLEDISVVLENGLVEGRFWLPLRQEIEIRRTGTWFDLPARGIIRARWAICCYTINHGLDPLVMVGGPEIVSMDSAALRRYPWHGDILDSLPSDVRVATDADVAKVRDYARTLVRGEALARSHETALSVRSISDFVRVDRVEGLALGAGATQRLGEGFAVTGRGRYGLSDHQAKGEADVAWHRADGGGLTLSAYRAFREAGNVPEVSGFVNSLATQEFGADHTDPYDTRGFGLALDAPRWGGLVWRLGVWREANDALRVHASPTFGAFAPTIPAVSLWQTLLSLDVSRPTAPGPFGTEVRWDADLRGGWYSATAPGSYARASVGLTVERPEGADRLVTRTTLAGITAGDVPIQDNVYLGGPVTGPGYAFHEFVGRAGASEHVEWQFPIPAPGLVLGRYGTSPRSATVAPFAHLVYTSPSGWYPSVGLGLAGLFDLVRFNVARGLRGGSWTFAFDLGRELWPVL